MGYPTNLPSIHHFRQNFSRPLHLLSHGQSRGTCSVRRSSWNNSCDGSIQEGTMLRIARSALASQIWELSRTNSVLITGSPGSGKSWTIAEFVRQCKAEKRPCLPLVAE